VNCDYFADRSPNCREKIVYDVVNSSCIRLGYKGCKEAVDYCYFINNACAAKVDPVDGDCSKIHTENDCMKGRGCDYFGVEDNVVKCSKYISSSGQCSGIGKFLFLLYMFYFFFFYFSFIIDKSVNSIQNHVIGMEIFVMMV
jgi:hypothetical protein